MGCGRGKNATEDSWKAVTLLQERNSHLLHQIPMVDIKGMDSYLGYILIVQPNGFADGGIWGCMVQNESSVNF